MTTGLAALMAATGSRGATFTTTVLGRLASLPSETMSCATSAVNLGCTAEALSSAAFDPAGIWISDQR
jgi:hypothetical protein